MRYLIYFLLLAICHHASYAEKIYKWTDENGKTHYSDKPMVKGSNKSTIIKTTKSPTRPLPSSDETESMKDSEVVETASANQSNVSQCLGIAREAAILPSTAHAKRKKLFKKLQHLCPNKIYECVSYKDSQGDIVCEASDKKDGGNFFTERKLNTRKPTTASQ